MLARGENAFQSAVARAYNSALGLGGGDYHDVNAPAGPNESAYLGVFRADALAAVGGYNESLRRGEDWELNHRLIESGRTVWLDPALRVTYRPRNSWPALARQFWATGVWRGELVRRLGGRNPIRFFAPPGLVVTAAAALLPIRRLRRAARLGCSCTARRWRRRPCASTSRPATGCATRSCSRPCTAPGAAASSSG